MRFSSEVSQKCPNLRGTATGSWFFWRSHAAWASKFEVCKVALKAQGRRRFYFGGELAFFLGIILIFVLFGDVGRSSGVPAGDRVQKVREWSFSREG